jgi:hypothetical protein
MPSTWNATEGSTPGSELDRPTPRMNSLAKLKSLPKLTLGTSFCSDSML